MGSIPPTSTIVVPQFCTLNPSFYFPKAYSGRSLFLLIPAIVTSTAYECSSQIAKLKRNSFHLTCDGHSPVEKVKSKILARNKVSVLIEQDVVLFINLFLFPEPNLCLSLALFCYSCCSGMGVGTLDVR